MIPDVVSTPAEITALPDGAVLLDRYGDPWRWHTGREGAHPWRLGDAFLEAVGVPTPVLPAEAVIAGPFRVIHLPEPDATAVGAFDDIDQHWHELTEKDGERGHS